MADETTEVTADPIGEVSTTDAKSVNTSPSAPDADDTGTTAKANVPAETTPEPTFFDPKDLPEELLPAYKNMQGAFTKKTQGIAEQRQKLEAYDQFMRDPVGSLRHLASQYGIQIADQPDKEPEPSEWEPQTWDDVIKKAKEEALEEYRKESAPLLREYQSIKKSQIETDLDSSIPEWRQYEDEMTAMVQQHPSLANDPVTLARLSIPPEVLEGRAMQAALARLKKQTESGAVSKGSTTNKASSDALPGNPTFQQAYEHARKQLSGV